MRSRTVRSVMQPIATALLRVLVRPIQVKTKFVRFKLSITVFWVIPHDVRTNKCTQMCASILYTPCGCYMFRPLMWPTSGRCITKVRWQIRRDITEDLEKMHRYKVPNFKHNIIIYIKLRLYYILLYILYLRVSSRTSGISRCICSSQYTTLKMATWVTETCRRYTVCV